MKKVDGDLMLEDLHTGLAARLADRIGEGEAEKFAGELVALFASTTPPQGWKLCNGQGGAPDLTGYTSAPLTYVQKGA